MTTRSTAQNWAGSTPRIAAPGAFIASPSGPPAQPGGLGIGRYFRPDELEPIDAPR